MTSTVKSKSLTQEQLINIYLETKDSLGENINAELEVRFGTKNIGKITKNRFDNTIKYLLANNFDFSDNGKYYLSIKADDIRVEIDNINNIQTYCKTNSLPTEYPTQGYTFTEKTSYLIDDTIQAKVNLDNFNFRITYSKEKNLMSETREVQELITNWASKKSLFV